MTRLKLNAEYLKRHLFVVLVMLGMGGWFGYDGLIRYPSLSAEALYADCHSGAAAASPEAAAKFKAAAVPRQLQFMWLCFGAALVVGVRLALAARMKVAFDENGFSCGEERFSWQDVTSVDRSRWTKKGIVGIVVKGRRIRLDAWHHRGVKEFESTLKGMGK